MRRARVSGEGDDEQGLAWKLSEVGGSRFVAHSGDTIGQNSTLWMVPEDDFAFVLLTNADRGDLVCGEISRWVRREFLDVEEEEPEPMEVAQGELEEYAGRYVLGDTGDAIDLRVKDAALRFEEAYGNRSALSETDPEPPPPAQARIYARDRLILIDGPHRGSKAEFLRASQGRIRWLRAGMVYARQDG
jgi:hypothetical protein